jgi:hypothetical protein
MTLDAPVTNIRPATHPIAICCPNGTVMHATQEADLLLSDMPADARRVYIVPEPHSLSLLSIGQFCDAGCAITLDKTTLQISYRDKLMLTGTRTPATKLWHVTLPPLLLPPVPPPVAALTHALPTPTADLTTTHEVAAAGIGSAKPTDLVAFAHAAMFSPALSTLHEALKKNYLPGIPGLTAKTLRKHPPFSAPMLKGHLDQTRQNTTRSTRPIDTILPTADALLLPTEIAANYYPPSDPDNHRTHYCFASVIEPVGRTENTDYG